MLFEYFENITFTQPLFFWLLLLIPILIYWYARKNRGFQSSIKVSTLSRTGFDSFKSSLKSLPFILKLLSIICIIIALAKPQTSNEK
ncbi:MAG: BatA domain-containing protein [Ferruginibacter sp.]